MGFVDLVSDDDVHARKLDCEACGTGLVIVLVLGAGAVRTHSVLHVGDVAEHADRRSVRLREGVLADDEHPTDDQGADADYGDGHQQAGACPGSNRVADQSGRADHRRVLVGHDYRAGARHLEVDTRRSLKQRLDVGTIYNPCKRYCTGVQEPAAGTCLWMEPRRFKRS